MANQYRVRFLPQDIAVTAGEGASLYDLARNCGAMQEADCGGNGQCGKCRVTVTADGVDRSVLACQTVVTQDMTVHLPASAKINVLTHGVRRGIAATPHDGYDLAFDIGTTTIVCYLLSGRDGRQLAVNGQSNPQASFGADVMTRASYALAHGGAELQRAVVAAMNRAITACISDAHISTNAITRCAVVGNTVMQHLLLGISPEPLTHAPFQPHDPAAVTTSAGALALSLPPDTPVHVLPLIAGFVGADTVGCLLATDFPTLSGNTLLMDIGTNGELMLGNAARRIACSTAAGPAFEGAKIRCGMRGATGAIDHAQLKDGELSCSVIGGGKPVGICGSGLVDIAACLLAAGTLTNSGLLRCDAAFSRRVITLPGNVRAFIVVPGNETESGEPILLTQQDVRELQLAKAAMAAGVHLLADALAISIADIDRVLIAGAFGNYLDAKNACAIGLIPPELLHRTESIGNAAGEGAKLAAHSDAERTMADTLASSTEYLDLGGRPAFMDRFVAELPFPEANAHA